MKLHERTGKIISRTKYGHAIVEFDSYDPAAPRCCSHPQCEARPQRQATVMFGLNVRDERAVEGARVRTYWMRDGERGGLVGEVIR